MVCPTQTVKAPSPPRANTGKSRAAGVTSPGGVWITARVARGGSSSFWDGCAIGRRVLLESHCHMVAVPQAGPRWRGGGVPGEDRPESGWRVGGAGEGADQPRADSPRNQLRIRLGTSYGFTQEPQPDSPRNLAHSHTECWGGDAERVHPPVSAWDSCVGSPYPPPVTHPRPAPPMVRAVSRPSNNASSDRMINFW
jgi:hypothetical protein